MRGLTLDPQCVFVAHRATQLGLQTERFRAELRASLEDMHQTLTNLGADVWEIRTYDDFPTQIAVAADDDAYICTVARASRSRQECGFRVKRTEPGVERSFVFHFDTLWTIASPYSPSRGSSGRW